MNPNDEEPSPESREALRRLRQRRAIKRAKHKDRLRDPTASWSLTTTTTREAEA